MLDRGALAVEDGARRLDETTEGLDQRLVAEADTEERHPSRRHSTQLNTTSRIPRRAGPGRKHQQPRTVMLFGALEHLRGGNDVSPNLHVGAPAREFVDQIP